MAGKTYHVDFDIALRENTHFGVFVCIEGIDGSGKTTQAKALVKRLNKAGYKAVYTRQPTDSEVGKLIRRILNGEFEVPSITFQYLFSADRGIHLEKVEGLLSRGYVVVTDRYFWSSVAYGLAQHEDENRLLGALSVLSFYHQYLCPDITFYLDVSPKEAMERISASREGVEIFEKEEKLVEIAEGYSFLRHKFPDVFSVVDGTMSLADVEKELFDGVAACMRAKSVA